jgi:hypothetical protein
MRRKGRRRRWLIAGCGLLILLFFVDYIAYPLLAQPSGPSVNRGTNGLWLSDRWYRAPASPQQIAGLTQSLKAHQTRYAYIRVGSVGPDGRLRLHSLENASRFVRSLHASDPGVSAIAWVYAGNKRGRGHVDLVNSAVRSTMADEASWLVQKCGFDGIQWDYEICPNGDQNFLALLKETHAAMPAGKLLSVATSMWLPAPFRHWGWDDSYFAQVAEDCDQIAVMCYDSGLWGPRAYVWLVGQQAEHVTQDVSRANPHCAVLLGVPTYISGGLSHDPHSENLRLALIGVRDGLRSNRAKPSAFAGVAIFADYTTTPADWRIYARLWQPV